MWLGTFANWLTAKMHCSAGFIDHLLWKETFFFFFPTKPQFTICETSPVLFSQFPRRHDYPRCQCCSIPIHSPSSAVLIRSQVELLKEKRTCYKYVEIYFISLHEVLYNLLLQLVFVLFSTLFYFRRGPFSPGFHCKHIGGLDLWFTSFPVFSYLCYLVNQRTSPVVLSTERLKW